MRPSPEGTIHSGNGDLPGEPPPSPLVAADPLVAPLELIWRLRERVKELTALHRTSRLLQDANRPVPEVMERLERIFRRAWQFPRVTAVRIRFDGEVFSSADFKPTRWRQRAVFHTRDGRGGSLEIVYLRRRPPAFEGPFLQEERELIESLAKMLQGFFNRRLQEEEGRRAHDALEIQVRERTASLTELNQTLMQEIEQKSRARKRIRRYQVKLRRLVAELSLTEERERRAIAADLHDQVGQSLALARSKLVLLHGESIFYGMEGEIEEVRRHLDLAIAQTRSLTSEICSPVLYELGLAPAFDWLAERFRSKHRLPMDVSAQGSPRMLDEKIQSTLFRVVRELLRNIVKHARATRVRLTSHWEAKLLTIVVADDGVGFDPARILSRSRSDDCFGLFHARERLRHLGGSLEIHCPEKGTEIRLVVPL